MESQKTLKLVAIVLIIYAGLMLFVGILLSLGVSLPGIAPSTFDLPGGTTSDLMALGVGLGFILSGALYLLIGIFGLRGAKDANKIGPFYYLCLVGLALTLISLAVSLTQGSFNISSLISILVILICATLAHSIRKENLS